MTSEEVPQSPCPRCGAWQDDLDGFGVLFCEKCLYCEHPSCSSDRDGVMRCGICGDVVERHGDAKETA